MMKRSGPGSVSSRTTRPQQPHRKINTTSGSASVMTQIETKPPPSSAATVYSAPQRVHIPSLIDKNDHVQVKKPYKVPQSHAEYDTESNAWTATTLPKEFPDRREDVHVLDDWLTERLSGLTRSHPEKWSSGAAEVSQKQLTILNKGFFELVRQVGLQCSDRAELMLRMWRASHELYENVIRDLTSTITEMRHNAEIWKEKHEAAQKDMDILMWKQEKQLESALDQSKSHKSEDSAVYREMQAELFQREKDMNAMESTLSDLSIWFPNFKKYSSSVLRKQLPVSLVQADKKNLELPQDFFLEDIKRVQEVVNTVAGSDYKMTRDESVDDESVMESKEGDSDRIRELVVDNQLQGIVLQENENRLKHLQGLEVVYKKRIEELTKEINTLQNKVDEGSTIPKLEPISCFLRSSLAESVASETADLYIGIRSRDSEVSIVPPNIVAVGDLQASLHKCCSNFLANKLVLNWRVQKGCTNERGMQIESDASYWKVTGSMNGISGPEMHVNSFESLFSFYLLQQTRNKTVARECLRRSCWSALLWKNKSGMQTQASGDSDGDHAIGESKKSIFNHVHSHTSKLPRQLVEHEKAFVVCFCRLLGYFKERDDENVMIQSLYFNLFMRAFGTMQQYIKTTERAHGVLSSSSNLYLPACASLIPVGRASSLLRRMYGSPKKPTFYRPVEERRYSRAVQLSVTEKMEIFGGKNATVSNKTWWTCLPNHILTEMNEDVHLLSQKVSSTAIEVYSAIDVMWDHTYRYYKALFDILENLFVFLEAVTDGPVSPMFSTLLMAFLERKDTPLTIDHRVLASELVSMSAEGHLTPSTFAATILKKQSVYLTGLHILFEPNARLAREIRREALDLLESFKQKFVQHEKESDPSSSAELEARREVKTYLARNVRRLTVCGRQAESVKLPNAKVFGEASSCLDESSSYFSSQLGEESSSESAACKQFDVLLSYSMFCLDEESLHAKSDANLPHYLKTFDIFCAHVAMKCLQELHQVTNSNGPVKEMDQIAAAAQHRDISLSRRAFVGWWEYLERVKRRDQESESDEGSDDEGAGSPPGVPSGRRQGKAMKVFTIKEE